MSSGDWANMQRRGEQNPAAKLSEADVQVLRTALAAGIFSRSSLAREFGVSRAATHHVETGRNWGYLR